MTRVIIQCSHVSSVTWELTAEKQLCLVWFSLEAAHTLVGCLHNLKSFICPL